MRRFAGLDGRGIVWGWDPGLTFGFRSGKLDRVPQGVVGRWFRGSRVMLENSTACLS